MKRFFLIAGVVAFSALGCATVNIAAPPGAQVRVAAKGPAGVAGCTLYGTKRNMYLLWGLVPLGDNSTQTIMPKSGEVVVQTQVNFFDVVLSVLGYWLTLYFNTANVYTCSR